jgi:DNA invertase Pin-like site-specific DNA recombinase
VTLQTRELEQFAGARGWHLAGVYVDQGVSGSKDSRPELNRLMADAHKRRFDVVCVCRFDRFARSVSHLLRALETFKALGIDFVSFSEQMDTSTPAGKMVFTVLGAVAELERSLIVERVRAGLRNARVKGKRLGRPSIAVDTARIAHLRIQGLTVRQIATELGYSRSLVHTGSDSITVTIPRGAGYREACAEITDRRVTACEQNNSACLSKASGSSQRLLTSESANAATDKTIALTEADKLIKKINRDRLGLLVPPSQQAPGGHGQFRAVTRGKTEPMHLYIERLTFLANWSWFLKEDGVPRDLQKHLQTVFEQTQAKTEKAFADFTASAVKALVKNPRTKQAGSREDLERFKLFVEGGEMERRLLAAEQFLEARPYLYGSFR